MVEFIGLVKDILKQSLYCEDIARRLLLDETIINIKYSFDNTEYYKLGLYSIEFFVDYKTLNIEDVDSLLNSINLDNNVIEVYIDGGCFSYIDFDVYLEKSYNYHKHYNIISSNIPLLDNCYINLNLPISLCSDMRIYEYKCIHSIELQIEEYELYSKLNVKNCIQGYPLKDKWIIHIENINQLEYVYTNEPSVLASCCILEFILFFPTISDLNNKLDLLKNLILNKVIDGHISLSISFYSVFYKMKEIDVNSIENLVANGINEIKLDLYEGEYICTSKGWVCNSKFY